MTAQTIALVIIALIVSFGTSFGILPESSEPLSPPSLSDSVPTNEQETKLILGYYMQDTGNDSWSTLQNNKDVLSAIAPWSWGLTPTGTLRPVYMNENNLADVLRFAGRNGVETYVLIHNFDPEKGSFDPRVADEVLTDDALRQRAATTIAKTAAAWGVSGVHIDFEGLHAARRDDFSQFIAELRQTLQERNIGLSIAVPAKTYATANAEWTKAYDYETLARHVDFVVLMAYDFHWSGGTPGPVAPLPWVRDVIDYTLDARGGNVSSDKVVLGIPAYGYDWPSTGGFAQSVTFAEVSQRLDDALARDPRVAVRWHADYMTPHLSYEGREIWFENAASIARKVELAREYNLRGIALWRLGQEDPDVWRTLSTFR